MTVLGFEVKMSGTGEDIWVAVLGPDVRVSGPCEDILVAVSAPEDDMPGNYIFGLQF